MFGAEDTDDLGSWEVDNDLGQSGEVFRMPTGQQGIRHYHTAVFIGEETLSRLSRSP